MEKVEFEWDKERRFEIEKVPPVYLITALCVVPFAVYYLLNFLSPLIHRITAMRISEVSEVVGIDMDTDFGQDLCLPDQISPRRESARSVRHAPRLQTRPYFVTLQALPFGV